MLQKASQACTPLYTPKTQVVPIRVSLYISLQLNCMQTQAQFFPFHTQAQAVGLGLLQRFQTPPVTLLFNGSSFHSTMALFTDLQQVLANVNASVLVGLNDTQVHTGNKFRIFDTLRHLFSWVIATGGMTR